MTTNRPRITERKIDIAPSLRNLSNPKHQTIPDAYELNVKLGGPDVGPALVFLHGGGGESNNFKHQLNHYAAQGYRVIAIDGNGSGKSDFRPLSVWAKRHGAPPTPHEEHAHDLRAVLDALGIEKAVLIGHSDGAAIAQTFSALYPERVAGQVLVGGPTHYCFFDKVYNALLSIIMPSADQYPRAVAWAASRLFFSSNVSRRAFLKENQMPKPRAMRNWVRSFEFFQTLNAPPKIPTLVVFGENDVLTKKQQPALAKKWRADLVPISNAGHLPFWEQPVAFNAELSEYLTRLAWFPVAR